MELASARNAFRSRAWLSAAYSCARSRARAPWPTSVERKLRSSSGNLAVVLEPELERADGAAPGHEGQRDERAGLSVQRGERGVPGAPLDPGLEVYRLRVPRGVPERPTFRRGPCYGGVSVEVHHVEGVSVAPQEGDRAAAGMHRFSRVAHDDARHLRRTEHRAERQVQRVNPGGAGRRPLGAPTDGQEERDEPAYEDARGEIRRQVAPVARAVRHRSKVEARARARRSRRRPSPR